ncbi:MAG: carbohydrate kinase family protein [Nitriliruptorales bacterium]
MAIAVTGSIAHDYLMRFDGRFSELIVEDQLRRLSLSFLVDDLEIRRGGVAANIAFGMAQLGLHPVLVGAVGDDFNADYRSWLERHGVDTASVRVSEVRHTARFHCTTDLDNCQIASFYTGAMEEAREIELHPVADRVGDIELVVVSPNDPVAMLRHTEEARQAAMAFVADPSQQLARMSGTDVRELVDGAAILVCNDYERTILESKTGWDGDEVLDRVGVRVTTYGADGCAIEREGDPAIEVAAFPEQHIVDPTGVGDGFRAGLLAGRAVGLSLERSAQVGSAVATLVLESIGTQEYRVQPETFLKRLAEEYGDDAAAEIAAGLPALSED